MSDIGTMTVGVAIAWLAFSSCQPYISHGRPGIVMNESLAFRTAAERHEAEQRALAGDIEAARSLANEALYVQRDVKKAVYWCRIGASHGDAVSRQNLKTLKEIYPPTI